MQNQDPVPSTSGQAEDATQVTPFDELSRNPFVNFARPYHRKGLRASEAIKRAAQDWNRLTPEDKEPYQREAAAALYRGRTRNRTFNRILKLLDDAENSSDATRTSTTLARIGRMTNRWALRSYRSAISHATFPQLPPTRRRRAAPQSESQMYT